MRAYEAMISIWGIDASFAIHPESTSNTTTLLGLGKGTTYYDARKQNINGKSSTKNELIEVEDFIWSVLWTQIFMAAEGYEVDNSIVCQDNWSTILLKRN